MKRLNLMNGLLCCLAVAGVSGLAQGQMDGVKDAMKDAKKAAEKAVQPEQPAMDEKMAAEMEAWMKAATPGAEHAQLKKAEGSWNCTVKTMMPGMPSEESKGTMTIEMIFEGRYQKGHFKGSMMGQPFDGMMVTGFNNAAGEFESMWIDSMSTMMMISKGKNEGDTCVMKGEMKDPASGKMIKTRDVTRWVNNDQFVMDFFHTKDGKEEHVMTITYDRAKGGEKQAEKTGANDAMKKAQQEAERKAKEEAEKRLKDKIPGR